MKFVASIRLIKRTTTENISEAMGIMPLSLYTNFTTNSNSTKINIMTSHIPLPTRRIINLLLLIGGANLNFLIILVIVFNFCMRTPMNLYIISLAYSNMVILLEPLEQILYWFFNISTELNMDYVCLVNFNVSIVTIVILKLQLYLNTFKQHETFGQPLINMLGIIKNILLIWILNIMALTIELHTFEYAAENTRYIYIWNTFTFTSIPCILFVVIDSFSLYQLMVLKMVEGSWRTKELQQFYMLVATGITFFCIRLPYRLARAINFIAPTSACCVDKTREILFFIAKTYPIVFPIIYITLSSEFRAAFQEMLVHPYKKLLKTFANIKISNYF
ncbi:uncharacterized protein LOC143182071 [Calliopsis andreniformis]|uniref:uncharacterized protein LOC143182071 n=1 Tax=Calliopsis andreniformis TaxID=337506 RepID=UPI003FCE198D